MQDYYLKARAVTRARDRLLHRAMPPRRRGRLLEIDLGRGLRLFDGQIGLATSELAADPALALRMYIGSLRRKAPVLPFARDAVAQAASDPAWCQRLRESPEAAALFVELICHVPEAPTKRGSVAGELHDVGLLLAMIPEFQPVTGRVHHDVYHVYTVDVHSVAAVDALRTLSRGELAQEYPLATRLAAEIARPRPLFLATLLHDVGKGYPDATGSRKNHSQSGAEICDHLLPRLGMDPEEVKAARDLVAQHLAMYHTATRRDLDDPTTAQEFAKVVGNREALRDLYLLTIVDITTTSPTAMSSWKARMLDELYFATDAHLTEMATQHPSQPLKVTRELDGESDEVRQFALSMPERYALAHPVTAIRAHAEVARERSAKGAPVHAALVPSRHPEAAELCVVAQDRPGLLAGIAAAITAGRLEVLAAQVHSRVSAAGVTEAVDLFWVRDRVDGVEGVARAMPRLLRDLETVCSGALDPAELVPSDTSAARWRERPSPAIAPEVVIDDRASDRHSVVEIFAKDRPGLLYTIAHVFHTLGLSIATSKINTEGARVADVFYVTELDGSKMSAGERTRAVREALLAGMATP
jgi:[protein-PII] uridylyltransferase